MDRTPSVYVVILNWQGKHCLPEAIGSVFRQKYAHFEVVVVDNASTDGSLEDAMNHFGRVHFIRNEANVGFAAGMNVGIRYALGHGAEYVWLLNNDARADADALGRLVGAAKRRGKALLSPIITDAGGKIWFAGGTIRWLRMRTRHETEPKSSTQPYETGYLTGCALFFGREAIRDIGLFDEEYFLYYEDADLSVRAKRLGMRLYVVPGARVTHEERSEQNPQKTYHLVLSGLRFFRRQTPLLLRPWVICFTIARRIKNIIDVWQVVPGSDSVRRAYRAYAQSKARF